MVVKHRDFVTSRYHLYGVIICNVFNTFLHNSYSLFPDHLDTGIGTGKIYNCGQTLLYSRKCVLYAYNPLFEEFYKSKIKTKYPRAGFLKLMSAEASYAANVRNTGFFGNT